MSAPTTVVPDAPALLFEERLRPTPRAWLWFAAILVITFLALAPLFVPVAVAAWAVNIGRFWRSRVRIEEDYLWLGRRWVRLAALDLTTLGRAGNSWPWRAFSQRALTANPLWTRDSVGIRGIDQGLTYWVAIGTNRRAELVGVLERAVSDAQARVGRAPMVERPAPLPPAGWHPDPWDPARQLRWWDGRAWTGFTWPRAGSPA